MVMVLQHIYGISTNMVTYDDPILSVLSYVPGVTSQDKIDR